MYNSVDSEYIRQTTDKFNEKLKQDQLLKEKQEEEKKAEEKKKKLLADILAIEEIEKLLADLIEARKAQSQQHEQDDEMEM